MKGWQIMKPWILFLSVGFILSGCMGIGTMTKMEEKRHLLIQEEKINTYSEQIQQTIRNKTIVEGMNQDQVLLAIGPTGCISNGIYKGNRVEIWIYQYNPFKGRPMGKSGICQRDSSAFWKDTIVYFENGIVTGWENL
jgi:hypothetical protein